MGGRSLHPFSIGPAAGFSAVAVIVAVAAVHVRHHDAVTGSSHGGAAPSVEPGDLLSRELTRCKAAGINAKDDRTCEAAWAENRRRFFTYRPFSQAAPASNTAPNGRSPR